MRLRAVAIITVNLAVAAFPAGAGAENVLLRSGLGSVSSTAAMSQALDVSAQANIFGAGHSSPPAAGGNYSSSTWGGTLPPSVSFAAGSGRVLTVSNVSGTVGAGCGSTTNDPDGVGACDSTDMNSYAGISGITADHGMALLGVFLTDAEPTTAPAKLDFSSTGKGVAFSDLSPQIGQTFWIGDGLTGHGSGSPHRINVPANATRLFLGVADGWGSPCCRAYHGDPGWYDDNTGSFNAMVNISAGTATSGDTTPPVIEIESPRADVVYGLGQVLADYTCRDAASQIAECFGVSPKGSVGQQYHATINERSLRGIFTADAVGTFDFEVRAKDAAGNTSSERVTYRVEHDARLTDTPTRSGKQTSSYSVRAFSALTGSLDSILSNVTFQRNVARTVFYKGELAKQYVDGRVIAVGAGHVIAVGAGHYTIGSRSARARAAAALDFSKLGYFWTQVGDSWWAKAGDVYWGVERDQNNFWQWTKFEQSSEAVLAASGHIAACTNCKVYNWNQQTTDYVIAVGAGHVIAVGAGHVIAVGAGHIAPSRIDQTLGVTEPGKLSVLVYDSKGTLISENGLGFTAGASASKATTVAGGKLRFKRAGARRMKIGFSKTGQRALARLAKVNAKRKKAGKRPISVKLTLKSRFVPESGKPVVRKSSLKLSPRARSR